MADNVPDPRELKDWEDAFRYPVPAVRILEKKLRGGLEEGRERLRGVVGYASLPVALTMLERRLMFCG